MRDRLWAYLNSIGERRIAAKMLPEILDFLDVAAS